MQSFPHYYPASSLGGPDGNVVVSSKEVSDIVTAAPPEFGGPGDQWSPEALLVAAVADCFILTFRAISRASKLEWQQLRCDVVGVLDKVDRVTQFTEFRINVTLDVVDDANVEKAHRLLSKAEAGCLITNSLTADTSLESSVRVADTVPMIA